MKDYKIIATNTKLPEGQLLPMKKGKEQESKKSLEQQNEELCNFVKNAFVADGDVKLVKSKESIKINFFFLAEDSIRGKFIVAFLPEVELNK